MDATGRGFLAMNGPDLRDGVQVLASPGVQAQDPSMTTASARASANRLEILLLGALGAAVSLALTGYRFGILNNLFHLPIVAALYDEPQFAGDRFIQSLRYYSSGVWMLLDGSARYVSPYWLFLGLDYLSRLLSFIAFLCCGTLLGVGTTRARVIFVVILCFSSLLHGYSYPGNGGLFVNYFTHSEIANGTILLTFYFAARGRFAEALALNGLTFFINAFMATWTIPPLALIAGSLLWRRELTLRSLLRRAGAGLPIGALFALPVLWNFSSNPNAGGSIGIDFRRFLLDFYPDHVLFMIASPRHMVALATAIVYGFACLFLLGERAAEFRAALWGSVLLYAAGIVLPWFTGLPLLLNFHLIRSSAVIHMLVALASASLATTWLCGDDRNRSRFFGPLLVFAYCTWRSFLPIGLVAMAAAVAMRRSGWQRSLFRLDYAVGAVLLLFIWPRLTLQDVATNRTNSEQTGAWMAVGEWARSATRPDAAFLIPTERLPGETTRTEATADGLAPDPAQGSEIFEYASHRRVWVDFRRGAAVLWTPSYYAEWWPRVSQVMALRTLADKVAYARQHGIDYVVDACPNDSADHSAVATFRKDDLCVFPVSVVTGPKTGL
jgi:hypothetical protein